MLRDQNCVDKIHSPITKRGRQYLLASAAVALISLNGVSLVAANEWVGPINGDFFKPENWDDGQGPQGESSIVNNGKAIGRINITQDPYMGLLAEKIGAVSGADAEVEIYYDGKPSSWGEVGTHIGYNPVIGANGGKGKLSIVFEEAMYSRPFVENFDIGTGRGSYGEFNVIGTGKDAGQVPPEGPIIADYMSGYAEPGVLFFVNDDLIIGKNGGAGVINADGAIFGVVDRTSLLIGTGNDSQGTLNVLAGGKFSDGSYWADPHNYAMIIGHAGGTGELNIKGTGAEDRGNAPLASFARGLVVGDDGGNGVVNVLGGGKAHSYVNSRVLGGSVDPDDPAADWSRYHTKFGTSGGTGEVNVSGKGSVWYQSGITEVPLVRILYDNNGQPVLDDKGFPVADPSPLNVDYMDIKTKTADLFVGESGTGVLNIDQDGVVRVGTATFRFGNIITGNSGSYAYSLADHEANGSLFLGQKLGSEGTLNIGGKAGSAATSAGRLMAKEIVFGEGTGLVRFNHTNTDYVFDEFDAKYLNGSSRPQTLQLKGKGIIEAASGRTIFNQDQLDFTGELSLKGAGILQINGDMSGANANLTGGMLEGNGIVGNVVNKGLIAPGRAFGKTESSIGTLTVKGNYEGNGGGVLIDAVLGDDNSKADRLVVTGNTSGKSTVAVRNVGGKGADTVEGIEIITVGGSSEGAFKLLGNYTRRSVGVVVAGAHTYKLHQGSVSDPQNGN